MEILTSYWAKSLIISPAAANNKEKGGNTRWIDPENFKLKHHDIERFHRSEWSNPGTLPTWYAIYRVMLALVMGTGVAAHVYLKVTSPNPKWLIFMTNQGMALLALHYILHAWLVLRAKHWGSTFKEGTLPFLYKLSWALENMASIVALLVTLLFWTSIYPYFVEFCFLKTTLDEFMNFFAHALNTISYFVDFLISGRPKRLHHFYFGLIFGVWYSGFSVIYWAAGGTCRCAVRCLTQNSTLIEDITEISIRHGMCQLQVCDKVVCDDFIYPALDWSCDPLTAICVLSVTMIIGVPFSQLFWWTLYKLRIWLSRRFGSARFDKETEEPARAINLVTTSSPGPGN